MEQEEPTGAVGMVEVFRRMLYGDDDTMNRHSRGIDWYLVRERCMMVVLVWFTVAVCFAMTIGCIALTRAVL